MSNNKIPMRRCVGCMTSKPKKELVRLVAADGRPRVDSAGKANGRGVYLCADVECLEKALKRNALTRGLSLSGLDGETKDIIRSEFAGNL
ncbi:MAG: YlxR family protein [Clostridiales Family XIII bacterium]|nr:YlxR family protein [Clostridiales Family XIII bacterium]